MKTLILLFFVLFSTSSFSQEEKSRCAEEVSEVFNKFKPEFIELQSKLALYKTAWTTLVLNKSSGDTLVTMEKEISKVAKKIASKRGDPEFKSQYEKLINYRPYVDRFESRSETILPEAINLLAQNVNTDEFYDLVLSKVGEKDKVQAELKKYAVDIETVKTSQVLHDLYKNDPSSNSYLLKLTNQVSAGLRGRDSFQEKDKDYFENIIDRLKGKLVEKENGFIEELKKTCSSQEEAMKVINAEIICKNKNPSQALLTDLDKIFLFEPILDELNKEATLSYLKKEYLKVAPNNPKCEASLTEKNILFDVSSVPKNGDYRLTFYNGSEELVSVPVNQGDLKFNFNSQGDLVVYNPESKQDILVPKESIEKSKLISSWGNKKNGIVKCLYEKPKGSSWTNYESKSEYKNLSNLSSDEAKIVAYEKQSGNKDYVIVDEVHGKIKLISHTGKLIEEVSIKEGFDQGDEFYGALGNKTLGAGVYTLERKGKTSATGYDDILFLGDSKKQGISIRSDKSACEKCIRVPEESLKKISFALKKSSKVYVLPENPKNNFSVSSHGNLSFTPAFGQNDYLYNAPKKLDYYPTKFSLSKASLENPKDTWTKNIPWVGKKEIQVDTQVTQEFLKALETEKYTLMQLYNLSNDEYNELAKIAFGILGNESYFGNPSMPRAFKEYAPAVVPVVKDLKSFHSKDSKALDKMLDGEFTEAMKLEKEALGELWDGIKGGWSLFKNSVKHYNPSIPASGVTSIMIGSSVSVAQGEIDISSNSRGLIQMKNIPDKIEKKYKITKNDLMNPKSAAVAAIGFLAEAKKELEAKARDYNKNVERTRKLASGELKGSSNGVVKGHKYPDITNENWQKYVHYIYMGSSREITNATATPELNLYYKDIKYWNQALNVEERD